MCDARCKYLGRERVSRKGAKEYPLIMKESMNNLRGKESHSDEYKYIAKRSKEKKENTISASSASLREMEVNVFLKSFT
jgi:hypothetical protein